ncbi:putative 39S ribosomal protein L16, mitochondrial [Penaeus vannamei]|uniref:Putative 39S ribosomal protein L16, mitochondrial n=1 Tax=Penaeus vannamei TaxID=6689 RepID=A0A3R7MPN0_PENVA|nr:putative 39S ribosomal protein L16, mitochondrial [Penaeus vannamei]
MSFSLLSRHLHRSVSQCWQRVPAAAALPWIQKAGFKNFPAPPDYDDIEIPKERQKLRFFERVPQFPAGIRAPKMTKRLDLIRGEEEVHNNFIYNQYGIVARRGGMLRWGHLEMIRREGDHRGWREVFAEGGIPNNEHDCRKITLPS